MIKYCVKMVIILHVSVCVCLSLCIGREKYFLRPKRRHGTRYVHLLEGTANSAEASNLWYDFTRGHRRRTVREAFEQPVGPLSSLRLAFGCPGVNRSVGRATIHNEGRKMPLHGVYFFVKTENSNGATSCARRRLSCLVLPSMEGDKSTL